MKRFIPLYLAWVVSLGGLLLSLYYGEVLGIEPCRLCWYQRMALFPLPLLLGIASYSNRRDLPLYSLPLVGVGGLFALYQSMGQLFPSLQTSALCGASAHCATEGILPFVSAAGFGAIACLILLATKGSKD